VNLKVTTSLEISAHVEMITTTARSKPDRVDKTKLDNAPTLRETVLETNHSSRSRVTSTLTKRKADLKAVKEPDPMPLREISTLKMLERLSSLSVESARTLTKAIYVKFSNAMER
jgi:hypothetical protein